MAGLYSDSISQEGRAAEIVLIAPTVQLGKNAKKIIESRKENIDVYVCLDCKDALEDALEAARSMVDRGVKVIISRKGTAEAIRKLNMDVSVVEINSNLSDYIEAIEIAKSKKGLIGFFTYSEITEDIKSLCYMLGIKTKYYSFKSDKDCEVQVKEALKDGVVLGIGGVMNQKYSKIYNLPHITIENSDIAISNAIDTAKQLLLVKKEELRKNHELKLQLERYKAVLNFTHDAIIAVDEEGRINVINPVAEEIVKIPSGQAVGKDIGEVIVNTNMFKVLDLREKQLNQIMDINGTIVSTNRIPIIVDDKVRGVVATFQDIRVIQENENKIRRSLYKKGLVAKYKFSDIKGQSKEIKSTIDIAKTYALSDSTVMIHGKSGTGKELFAQSIHNSSTRREGPFVAINCAAIASNLLESELFGYAEGA